MCVRTEGFYDTSVHVSSFEIGLICLEQCKKIPTSGLDKQPGSGAQLICSALTNGLSLNQYQPQHDGKKRLSRQTDYTRAAPAHAGGCPGQKTRGRRAGEPLPLGPWYTSLLLHNHLLASQNVIWGTPGELKRDFQAAKDCGSWALFSLGMAAQLLLRRSQPFVRRAAWNCLWLLKDALSTTPGHLVEWGTEVPPL